MEESKELQNLYRLFQGFVIMSVMMEFFMFALTPEVLGLDDTIVDDVWQRIKVWTIYQDHHLAYSKIATFIISIVTCIGTRNKKDIEFDARKMVFWPLVGGFILILASVWLYYTDIMNERLYVLNINLWLYMICTVIGTVIIHAALDAISKYIKGGVMKDRFNLEMEAFEQNEKYEATPYSVNIPMMYYYNKKFRHGWININNPFRGTFVIGTPGSGKSFSVIEPFIRQHSEKGFSMMVYDYKFPTLATKLYYHYRKNKEKGKIPKGCKFNMINFVDVEYSRRVNPIQHKYIDNLTAAQETADTLVQALQRGKESSGGGSDQFFQTSAVNFLAACIYFFVNYNRKPYDKDGNELIAETVPDKTYPEIRRLTGRVFDEFGKETEPDHWLGEYSDMPHVLSFLNLDYNTIFEILQTDPEVFPLLAPFKTAFQNKAMEQLEGMIGTLRVQTSRLATKESYWVFHRDGDDFDLKISDPANPSYLLIANDPEKESIIGTLNAMILNRLVTRVNSGMGKNVPVSIIVDELPTLYFHKIDNLIATARSNKVCVVLGFQELPQLEANYGKVNMEKIVSIIGNVISGSARNKETLEWLSNDIMGKIVQTKTNLSIDEAKTSVSINESLENMLPPSKISDMATGWLCGQVARDFTPTKRAATMLNILYKIPNFFLWLIRSKKRLKDKSTLPVWKRFVNFFLMISGFKKRLKDTKNISMNIQQSKEFQTSKFFCKTNFDMNEIVAEEKDYNNYQLPKFFKFTDKAERERILYANFESVDADVKKMVNDIQKKICKDKN